MKTAFVLIMFLLTEDGNNVRAIDAFSDPHLCHDQGRWLVRMVDQEWEDTGKEGTAWFECRKTTGLGEVRE